MKKRISLILSIVAIVIVAIALVACGGGGKKECKHPKATSSVTKVATCTTDGETTWKCPDCNKTWTTTISQTGHKFSEGKECEDQICENGCGLTKIATTQHKYVLIAAESIAATCSTAGKNVYQCSVCNDKYETPITKLSHHYELSTKESVAATCTTGGVEVYVCTNEGCDESYEKPVAALEHKFTGATCKTRACENEGCDVTLPATTQHHFERDMNKSFAQTCTVNGKDVFECRDCHDTYETTLYATGHEYSEWQETGDEYLKDGETCVYVHTLEAHCYNCPDTITDTEEEVRHNFITRISKVATCTETGTKEKVCADCGTVANSSAIEIDATAHKWVKGEVQGNVTVYTCEHNQAHTKKSISSEGKSATVSKEALKEANDIVTENGSIEMDQATKDGLEDGELVFTMDILDDSTKEGLNSSGRLDEDVYSITLTRDGNPITDEFDGYITVRIPYVLGANEDADAITVLYVDQYGDIELIEATYSDGYAVFKTRHFSFYTVGKLTPAEMCERYNRHNIVVREKRATCTTGGYYIEVCSRCGEIFESTNYNALGHSMVKDTAKSVEATCTTAGKIVRNCERCDLKTETTVPAIGHNWVKDTAKSVAATCTAAGKNVYVCDNCNETYTVTTPQLVHSYQKKVTPATCTEQGYTTYTCANCGHSYKDNYTDAKGHNWDIAAPTCGQGQTCKTCGEKGLPATGNHTYGDNGVCTVCGSGCNHNYTVVEEKESTCIARGYKVYKCSVCGAEEYRDYKPLADHKYNNGYCTVCGDRDAAADAFWAAFAESILADSYVLSIEDLNIAVEMIYGENESEKHILDYEVLEGYITFTEDGFMLIMKVKYTQEDIYTEDGEEDIDREIYESIILYDGEFSYTKDVDEDGNESYSISRGDSTFAMLSFLADESLKAMISSNADMIGGFIEAFFSKIFIRTEESDGYRYTLNNAVLIKLNKDLYTLTVAQFIDEYFGEGTFDSLAATITELITEKKVPEAIDAIVELTSQFGIDKETLFAIVESVTDGMWSLEDIYEDEDFADMTLAELIEMMGEMEEGTVAAMIDSVITMLDTEGTTVYSIVCTTFIRFVGAEEPDEPSVKPGEPEYAKPYAEGDEEEEAVITPEQIYDALNALLSSDYSFAIVTTKTGEIKSFELSMNGVETEFMSKFGDFGYRFAISGKVSLIWNGESTLDPEEADGFSPLFSNLRAKLAAADDNTITFDDGAVALSDGKIMLYITGTEEYRMETENYPDGQYIVYYQLRTFSFMFEDLDSLIDISRAHLSKDCGDWLLMGLRGEFRARITAAYVRRYYNANGEFIREEVLDSYNDDYYARGATLFFNPNTAEFTMASQHNWVLQPSSMTEDDVDCEEEWMEYFKCSACGEEYTEYHLKMHEFRWFYELIDGVDNCEDGFVEKGICNLCGDVVVNHYGEGYHPFTRQEEYIDTPHGTIVIETQACPCGENADFHIYGYRGDGCEFDYNSWAWQNGHASDIQELEGENHYLFIFNCAIQFDSNGYNPCNARIEDEVWLVEDACGITARHTVRLYKGNEQLGKEEGYSYENGTTWHDSNKYNEVNRVDYTVERDGYNGYFYERVYPGCPHNPARTETYELREDRYGRELYELRMVVTKSGEVLDYYRYVTTYKQCDYVMYRFDSPDDEGREVSRGIRHAAGNDDWTYVEATCTQWAYRYLECPECGEIKYEYMPESTWWPWHRPYEHRYENGVCVECGLENIQGSDGTLVLEDLSGRLTDPKLAGYKDDLVVGMYFRNGTIEVEYIFELVWFNLEGGESKEISEEIFLDYNFMRCIPEQYMNWGNKDDIYNSYILCIDKDAVLNALNGFSKEGCFIGLRVSVIPLDGFGNYQVTTITLTMNGEHTEHDFVYSEELTLRYEDVACEEFYYEAYVCTKCGFIEKRDLQQRPHRTVNKPILMGDTCMDGYYDRDICEVCGNTVWQSDELYYADRHWWNGNGFCERCGYECEHDWEQRENASYCPVCEMWCDHYDYKKDESLFDKETHICTRCGFGCTEHQWYNGSCWRCGYECEHEWEQQNEYESYCPLCDMWCGHYDDEKEGFIFDEDHICTRCGQECYHEWESGVCHRCGYECEHEWERDGYAYYCLTCGMYCEHYDYESGESLFDEDHVCTRCGQECYHEWGNGICWHCGYECEHEWEQVSDHESHCPLCDMWCGHYDDEKGEYIFDDDHICSRCGQECYHEWDNGVCNRCGKECEHNWIDNGDFSFCEHCDKQCWHSYYDQEVGCPECGKHLD